MSKYLTHLSMQAARYLNTVTSRPNDCPRKSLNGLFRKMCPPTFKNELFLDLIPVLKPDYMQKELHLI